MGLCKLCDLEGTKYEAKMPKVNYSLGNSNNQSITNYANQNLDYSTVLGGYNIR